MRLNMARLLVLCVIAGTFLVASVAKEQDSQDFEALAISPGANTSSPPSGWVFNNAQIVHPVSKTDFRADEPLAAPASGNQCLKLTGPSEADAPSFQAQPDTQYTVSFAVGADLHNPYSSKWRVIAFADLNGNGVWDVGEPMSQMSGAKAPTPAVGGWVAGSFVFPGFTNTTESKNIRVQIINDSDGQVYFDNIHIVAEPKSATIVGFLG